MSKTLLKAVNLNESRSSSHRWVHSILVPLEEGAGYAIGVIDLRGIDGDTEKLLDLFVDQIEKSVNTINAQSNLQHKFEQVVQGMNDRIAETASEQRWEFEAGDINALIGIAGSEQLYLTGVGDLTALFLHKSEQQRYKVFNLFRGIQTEHHIPDWHKLFTVVLDGDIVSGDVFLIGNREIPQQIDSDELHQILVTLPPLSASEKLRQYFPIPIDLSMIVMRAEDAIDTGAMEMIDAESSLDHFERTKDTTERMLEHQRPRKKDWISATKNTFSFTSSLVISSVNVTLAILMGLVKSLLQGIKLVTKSNKKQIWKSFRTNTIDKIKQPRGQFNRLPKQNKRLLTVIISIVLIFALVIVVSVVRKNNQREKAAYKELVQDIEKTYDTASASIIYKDEDQARELLLEGLASIANLPQNSQERKTKAEDLANQFDSRLNDLRHITEVGELELLASLPEGEEVTIMGFDNETSYAFTQAGGVYKYDSENSSFMQVAVVAPENFNTPTRVRYDDLNDVLYLFDGRQLAKFDADQETFEIVDIANLTEDTKDVEYFARRIYTLSPENEQVYRHDRDGDNFGAPSGWIQARTISLRDAISLSVDGSVWLLKENGRIVRYQKGFEETWPNPIIDPPISNSTVLWTTDLIDYIYLIDTENGRIVQIDKDKGTLTQQFTHEAFRELKGMWESDGNIFVLTPAGLHKFSSE